MNEISIVILNWNGRAYLEQFLPSVVEYSQGTQIIVADNASTDDSTDFLRREFPKVKIIENQSNGGFAKGYNDALRQVKSAYYLLLNSDIEVTAGWLEPLLERLESDETVAGVQPKVLSYYDRDNFEHAGASGGFLDKHFLPFCRGRIFASIEKDARQYDNAIEVFWATGAALLVRAEVFHKLGGFDEMFFAHMEEIDFCWRAKKLGYAFYVEPKSMVYHVGGGTLAYASPQKTYLNFRNSLYMIVKNKHTWLFPTLFMRMCIDGIAGIRFLCVGELKNFIAVLKAHVELYRNLNILLKERKNIRNYSREFHQNNNTKPNFNAFYRGSILWAYYFKRIAKFSELNMRLFLNLKSKN